MWLGAKAKLTNDLIRRCINIYKYNRKQFLGIRFGYSVEGPSGRGLREYGLIGGWRITSKSRTALCNLILNPNYFKKAIEKQMADKKYFWIYDTERKKYVRVK